MEITLKVVEITLKVAANYRKLLVVGYSADASSLKIYLGHCGEVTENTFVRQ